MPERTHLAELSAKETRLLEDLYCRTDLSVDELAYTEDMEWIHGAFVSRTGRSAPIRTLYLALRELASVGRLGGKARCFKCDALRDGVVAYLCPECFRFLRGLPPRPATPAGSCRALVGVCAVQVNWHPMREEDPSPWLENAIRCLEEYPP